MESNKTLSNCDLKEDQNKDKMICPNCNKEVLRDKYNECISQLLYVVEDDNDG